jgi:hypothetical protein
MLWVSLVTPDTMLWVSLVTPDTMLWVSLVTPDTSDKGIKLVISLSLFIFHILYPALAEIRCNLFKLNLEYTSSVNQT